MKKNFLFIVLILISILSCDKENDQKDMKPSTDLEFKLDAYGLFDVEKKFESFSIGIDTNHIYFNGRLDEKLCMEAFNKTSMTNLLSWESEDKLVIEVHEGFGVNSTHEISKFKTVNPYSYNENHVYILWGMAEGSQYSVGQRIITSDLYFTSVDKKYKSMTFPSKAWFYYNITPWYGNHIIVRKRPVEDWNALPDSLICYSMQGDEIFRIKEYSINAAIHQDQIAISVSNYIEYSGGTQGVFARKNMQLEELIWESEMPLSDLPEDTRIDKIGFSRINANSVLCKFDYTNYSGETGSREISVDIETGTFIVE